MTITEKIQTADEAQRRLADLEAEERGLAAARTTARRSGDTAEALRLEQRGEDLPDEIKAARLDLYRAQLDAAWTQAEEFAAHERAADLAHQHAAQAHQAFRDSFEVRERTAAELGAVLAEQGQLQHASNETRALYAEARHDTLLALHEVGRLETAIEILTGEPVPPGDGLRAPVRRLTSSVVTYHPQTYDARHIGTPRQQSAEVMTFTAGSRPPRWAAHELGADHPAWETT